MLVVDCSVAVKWFIIEPGRPEARRLLHGGDRLIAPELIVAEVVNVIWKRLLTGAIDHPQAADVPRELPQLFAELCPLAASPHGRWPSLRSFGIRPTTASISRSPRRGTPGWSRPIAASRSGLRAPPGRP